MADIVSQGVINVITEYDRVVIVPLAPVTRLSPERARALAQQIIVAAELAELAQQQLGEQRNSFGFPTLQGAAA